MKIDITRFCASIDFNSRFLLLVLSADPALQEVGWRGKTERGMQPLAVVKRLDVIKDVRPCFGLRAVARVVHACIDPVKTCSGDNLEKRSDT